MQLQPNLYIPSNQPPKTTIFNAWKLLTKVINKNITFGNPTSGQDNINGTWLTTVTPATPNTDFVLSHNLGRLPSGYIMMQKSAACDVYTGSVAATKTQITLRATVAGVTLVLFVI